MPKAPNKLFSRGEIRIILRELRNETARFAMVHRDANRNNASHVERTCEICIRQEGAIQAFDGAYVHFGGRNG